MTDISLPYDQVCEIIAETAREHTSRPRPFIQGVFDACLVRAYTGFGHKLWRALEEAHLARQREAVDKRK